MSLFGSKKKEVPEKSELPPLRFPDLPSENVPTYKNEELNPSEASMIKEAVQPAQGLGPVAETPHVEANPFPEQISPIEQPFQPIPTGPSGGEEKPIFVKIERYKDVMETLEQLKHKLKDAGDVLGELAKIKEEEDHEIDAWRRDLEALKGKLLTIDKDLFEL